MVIRRPGWYRPGTELISSKSKIEYFPFLLYVSLSYEPSNNMADEIRLCNPFNANGVLEYKKESNSFFGMLSYFANDIFASLAKRSNITFKIRSDDDGVGKLIAGSNGKFDGCIGLIQRNESDFMPREATYPSLAMDVDQGLLMWDSTIQFLSGYKIIPKTQLSQVISSFASFDRYVWILCISFLLVCYLALIVIHSAQRRLTACRSPQSKDKLYQVASHMTSYGCISDYSGAHNKLLFLSLSTFSLLVLFYFSSIIKTEIVVTKHPDSYRTYQDLKERKVSVAFLLTSDSHNYFKFAPRDTIERHLWEATLSKYEEHAILIKPNEANIAKVIERLYYRESAWMIESIWMPIVIAEICSAVCNQITLEFFTPLIGLPAVKAKTNFPIVAQDERARAIMKSFIFNQAKTNPLQRLRKTCLKAMEAGLQHRIQYEVKNLNLVAQATSNIVGSRVSRETADENYQKCIANTVVKPNVGVKAIKAGNMLDLLRAMTLMQLVSLATLLLECSFHRFVALLRKKFL